MSLSFMSLNSTIEKKLQEILLTDLFIAIYIFIYINLFWLIKQSSLNDRKKDKFQYFNISEKRKRSLLSAVFKKN